MPKKTTKNAAVKKLVRDDLAAMLKEMAEIRDRINAVRTQYDYLLAIFSDVDESLSEAVDRLSERV